MKKLLLTFFALQAALFVGAQQDVQFSQNRFLSTSINPGASGIKGMDCFGLIARQQWIGFEGAPTTAMLTYESALIEYNSGFGAVLVYDKIGFEQNLFFKGNYAYHFILPNGAKLGLGVDVGIISKQLSGEFIAGVASDPDLIGLNGQNSLNFDLGLGAFYYTNTLYFGVSGQKLVPQKINWGTSEPQIRPHTYFMGGYTYAATVDLDLKPSFLVKTDFTSTQVDVNLTAEYQKYLWLGASYRIQDAIVVNIGMHIKDVAPNPIKVGLAYDFTTSNLREAGQFNFPNSNEIKQSNRSVGSVELYLGYCFVKPEKPNFDHYVDPLFLNN
ncbi:MAG: type IX secretion system PorP/SprF family membrane protein [Saprospiraceae bacterium]|jgi:type IX secretion system PorP/SprF family membrane protein